MPIEGSVRRDETGALEAYVSLRVQDFEGSEIQAEFLIDTGFTGDISLTPEQANRLHLLPGREAESVLADGSIVVLPAYAAVVVWESGVQHIVTVVGQDAVPLLGMGLLAGHNLSLDVAEGGVACITALPPPH